MLKISARQTLEIILEACQIDALRQHAEQHGISISDLMRIVPKSIDKYGHGANSGQWIIPLQQLDR